jgi:hypothetical protein
LRFPRLISHFSLIAACDSSTNLHRFSITRAGVLTELEVEFTGQPLSNDPLSPDTLFAQILADRANDEPRLVWADREGGERGELVVIQCALARGHDPELARREAELLRQANAWAGLGDGVKPTFVRGFVERIDASVHTIAKRGRAIFAAAPLVTHVRVINLDAIVRTEELESPSHEWAKRMSWLVDALATFPKGRIRVLAARPEIVQLDGSHDPTQTVHRYDDELRAAVKFLDLERLIIE